MTRYFKQHPTEPEKDRLKSLCRRHIESDQTLSKAFSNLSIVKKADVVAKIHLLVKKEYKFEFTGSIFRNVICEYFRLENTAVINENMISERIDNPGSSMPNSSGR